MTSPDPAVSPEALPPGPPGPPGPSAPGNGPDGPAGPAGAPGGPGGPGNGSAAGNGRSPGGAVHARSGGARFGTGGSRTGPAWGLVLVLTLIGIAVGFLAKAPCLATYDLDGGGSAIDWGNGRQYVYACYSDTIPLYGLERLEDGGFPYKTSWMDDDGTVRYMEYPVLTGVLQYGVMRAAKAWVALFGNPDRPDPPEVVIYFVLMAVALALAWVVVVMATVPLLGGRRRDIILVALSPLVGVHLFTNFDALAVALAAGGLLAWARERPWLAGALLGLGAAAKLYPLFILGPLLILGLRTGRLAGWSRAATAAAVAWAAVNVPIALAYPEGWAEFYRLNNTRPADHDTIYFALRFFTDWQGFDGPLLPDESPRILNLVTLLLFALVCAVVAFVALRAPRRPRVASLVFLVVAGFLLTNKVWSPQYSLWLVPLAVLAVARWRLLLPWMVVDAAVWFPRMRYFLEGNEEWTRWFLTTVLIRDALVLGLMAIVVRDIYRPEKDPVRAGGDDDPCGGEFEGAADRPRLGEASRPPDTAPAPAT
jgi:uncharacterized membrane protein